MKNEHFKNGVEQDDLVGGWDIACDIGGGKQKFMFDTAEEAGGEQDRGLRANFCWEMDNVKRKVLQKSKILMTRAWAGLYLH